jgi:hypothetical protein
MSQKEKNAADVLSYHRIIIVIVDIKTKMHNINITTDN